MKSRIMYIEFKGDDISGDARIGRVTFSKTGRTIYYAGKELRLCKGYKYNCYDNKTGEEYWVSGCKKDGSDRLYSGTVEIDKDVAEEYWTQIRRMPEYKEKTKIRKTGKYTR
jgi:hypothetical protein